MAAGKFSGKALTNHLRTLAGQVHTYLPDGTPRTREELLAEMIWRQALGWEEESRDDSGNLTRKVHLPVAWAQQYLFERMEGRAPVSMPEGNDGLKASDKVRELAKKRLNDRAIAVSGVAKPPRIPPKEQRP